ncbi:hypothetical protein RKD23_000235 [Streptomyces sp. SAI-170]
MLLLLLLVRLLSIGLIHVPREARPPGGRLDAVAQETGVCDDR